MKLLSKTKNVLIFKVVPNDVETIHLIEPNLITIAYSEKITRDVDFANLDSNIESYLSNEVDWVGFNINKRLCLMRKSGRQLQQQSIPKASLKAHTMETVFFATASIIQAIWAVSYTHLTLPTKRIV